MQPAYHERARQNSTLRATTLKVAFKDAALADRHAEYLAARGVSRATAEAAGYATASKPSEVPPAFSDGQRRNTPALVAPHLSPSGAVGYQKRDDYPRKDRTGKPVKWATPKGARPVLSVHPWVADEAKTGTGPLWLPEGITRGHALAERGVAAVSYAGAYSWQKDGEPIECFDHLNLGGRVVYDVPDADYRTNAHVQQALARRVAFLESKGARVLVVDVPEIDGDAHTGLDDYLAAGGDPDALAAKAAPFVPVDVGRERVGRDEGLRRALEAVRRNADDLKSHKVKECSALAMARFLVEVAAPDHGKLTPTGVKVRPSMRQMAAGIGVGLGAVERSLKHLASVGFLRRAKPAKGPLAASYVLLCEPPFGGREFAEHIGEQGVAGKESQEHYEERENSFCERESSPSVPQTRAPYTGERARESVPPLRNSKVVHTYERREGRRIVVDSEYFGRYGKKREAIIRYVLEAGGADEAELKEKFGSRKARLRDFRRTWIKPLLDDRVLVSDGGTVSPAPAWSEALAHVRERTDEEADNRRQAEKYRRQSIAYRARLAGEARGDVPEPEPASDLMGKEKAKEVFAAAGERDAGAMEARRRAALAPAVAFIKQVFGGLAVARLGMLEDAWRSEGGLRWHLRRALKEMGCTPKRHAEHPGEWFVYPPSKWPEVDDVDDVDDAEVVSMRPETGNLFDVFRNTPNPRRAPTGPVAEADTPRKLPPKVGGVSIHGPECSCWICEDEAPAERVEVGATA